MASIKLILRTHPEDAIGQSHPDSARMSTSEMQKIADTEGHGAAISVKVQQLIF